MRYFIAAIVVALLVSPSWADTIKLTDGTVLRGKVKGKTAEKVILEYEKGKFRTIERSEIESVEKDDFEVPSSVPASEKAAPGEPPAAAPPKKVEPKGAGPPSQASPDNKKGDEGRQMSVEDTNRLMLIISPVVASEVDVKKLAKITGEERDFAGWLELTMKAVNIFFRKKDGTLNQSVNKYAFFAAIDNITPAKLDTAMSLIPKRETESPRLYAFVALLVSSREFVYAMEKVNTDAFDSALGNITKAKIEKTKDIVRDDAEESEPLSLLLCASAHFVNKEGKFDKDAFNTAFDAITREKIAAKMKDIKEMKERNARTAFDLLLRPSAP